MYKFSANELFQNNSEDNGKGRKYVVPLLTFTKHSLSLSLSLSLLNIFMEHIATHGKINSKMCPPSYFERIIN